MNTLNRFSPTGIVAKRQQYLRALLAALTVILAAYPVHAQWESMFPDSGLREPFLVSGRTILVANGPAGLWRSSDDGKNWARVEGAINDEVVTCLHDNGTALFCGTYAGLHVSFDSGRTWARTDSGVDMRFIGVMASVNSHLVVSQGIYAPTPRMYRSTDAGKRWETVRFDITLGQQIHHLVHAGSLFLAIYRGRIILSRDTGWTWTNTGIECSGISASDSLLVYNNIYSVVFSTDAGNSWEERISGLPPGYYIWQLASTGDTVFSIGQLSVPYNNYTIVVFMSTNAGRDWTFVQKGYRTGQACTESDLYVHGGYVYLRCGGKIWRRSIHELATTMAAPEPASVTALRMATHPNPSDGRFTLSWASPGYRERGTVQAVDLLGRRVFMRENGPMPAGEGSVELDARSLAPGVYILVLTSGNDRVASLLWIRR